LFLDVLSKEAKVLLWLLIQGRSATFLKSPLFKTAQLQQKSLTQVADSSGARRTYQLGTISPSAVINGLAIAAVGRHCLTLGRGDEGNPGESQNLRKSRRPFPLGPQLEPSRRHVKLFMDYRFHVSRTSVSSGRPSAKIDLRGARTGFFAPPSQLWLIPL
jgi:hypothetical protein